VRAALVVVAVATSLAAAGLGAGACRKDDAKGQRPSGPPPAAPVEVDAVVRRDVPVQLRTIGTVVATATVAVRPQVSGLLTAVHFAEGQDVALGALLFTIDPRPFDAAIEEARSSLARQKAQGGQAAAALARDQAELEQARSQRERYAGLLKRGFSTPEQVDELRTREASLAAAVRADRAAIATAAAAVAAEEARLHMAELNRAYAEIRAPLAAHAGELLADPGNLVGPSGATPLVVLHQVTPIEVAVAVPQHHLPALRREVASAAGLAVAVTPQGDDGEAVRGAVTFVDNAVDAATGTVRVKARFDNADRRLWPGQLVTAVLTLDTLPHATVAPTAAVLTGQRGPYAWVVRADGTVEDRVLTLGPAAGDDAVVVTSGLVPGETVVVDGQLRLVPGAAVAVRGGAAGRAPAAAPGQQAPGSPPAPTGGAPAAADAAPTPDGTTAAPEDGRP
jgi:multidrug efflux system membrane fusion protein